MSARADISPKRARELQQLAENERAAAARLDYDRRVLMFAMRQAAAEGAGTRVIAKAVGRSHVQVSRMLQRGEGPMPDAVTTSSLTQGNAANRALERETRELYLQVDGNPWRLARTAARWKRKAARAKAASA